MKHEGQKPNNGDRGPSCRRGGCRQFRAVYKRAAWGAKPFDSENAATAVRELRRGNDTIGERQ